MVCLASIGPLGGGDGALKDGAVLFAVVATLGVGFVTGRIVAQQWPGEKAPALDGEASKRRGPRKGPRSDAGSPADAGGPAARRFADDATPAGGPPEVRQESTRLQRASVLREAYFVEAVSPEQPDLMAGARVLSQEAFEEEPRTQKGERVAVLVLGDEVVAYVAYIPRPTLGSFNINKLAVSSARRRLGLGRRLLKETVQLAKRTQKEAKGSSKQPIEAIVLSALPTAIDFYKVCGFREEPDVRLPEEEDLEEGQVYMELPLRRRRK